MKNPVPYLFTVLPLVVVALTTVSCNAEEDRPDAAELKEKLTPMQYRVAVEDGTEPAFDNEYWDNKKPGIYVDIISGEPLFSSTDKFKSGTGWPSFTKPLEDEEIVEVVDRKFGMVRTEVRSKTGDAHLGHVFPDGPLPTGQRYCINSASLRFIPVAKLESEGLGQFVEMFKDVPAEGEEETIAPVVQPKGSGMKPTGPETAE